MSLVKAPINLSHDFGYVCHLPQNITVKNVTMTKYEYAGVDSDGNRIENVLSVNEDALYLYQYNLTNNSSYISESSFVNPYVVTQSVTIVNDPSVKPVKIVWPLSPSFNDMEITVDGVDYTIKNGVVAEKDN